MLIHVAAIVVNMSYTWGPVSTTELLFKMTTDLRVETQRLLIFRQSFCGLGICIILEFSIFV